MEDLQDLHGAERGAEARARCDLPTRRILAHRLIEWIAKASLEPVDVDPWRFLTRWADEGAKVFLEPLYRNLVDFAQQLVGRIAPMVDGEEHFHALLRDMCKDGRLFPGPPTPVIEASGEENKNTPRAKLPPRLRRLVDANA